MNTVVTHNCFTNHDAPFPLAERTLAIVRTVLKTEKITCEIKYLGRDKIDRRKTEVKVTECPRGTGLLLAVYLPGLRQRFVVRCRPVVVGFLLKKLPQALKGEKIHYVYGDIPACE